MRKKSQAMAAIAFSAVMFLPMQAQAAASAAVNFEETAATVKKPKKITDRNHPDYIRCRSEPIIGSLARKRRICMTNKKWARHIREGNKRTGQFLERMKPGGPNGS